MDHRIAQLETDNRDIKSSLVDVKVDLAELKGKVSQLPGYGGLTLLLTAVGAGLLIASSLLKLKIL